MSRGKSDVDAVKQIIAMDREYREAGFEAADLFAPVVSRCFAIDFDDTFTADPGLWACFIRAGKARGHRFFCVTARRDSIENIEMINDWFDSYECQMPVIFSNLDSKVTTMEKRGIKVDIWIDDAPYALVHGH